MRLRVLVEAVRWIRLNLTPGSNLLTFQPSGDGVDFRKKIQFVDFCYTPTLRRSNSHDRTSNFNKPPMSVGIS